MLTSRFSLFKGLCLKSFHYLHSSVSSSNSSLQQIKPNLNESSTFSDQNLSDDFHNPLNHPDYFDVKKLFTLKDLFEARVHFGHKEGTLNEHMTPYIYGSRNGVLIFDLNQTVEKLRAALNFTAHISFRGGLILFISNHRETSFFVEKAAQECNQFAHCQYYSEQCFTNSEKYYGCVVRLPDLVIFINTFNNVLSEHLAVRDSAKMLIPSIGIVDTNSDPTLITYPVPGNDDTPSAIRLYCDVFKKAVLLGKQKRDQFLAKYGRVPL